MNNKLPRSKILVRRYIYAALLSCIVCATQATAEEAMPTLIVIKNISQKPIFAHSSSGHHEIAPGQELSFCDASKVVVTSADIATKSSYQVSDYVNNTTELFSARRQAICKEGWFWYKDTSGDIDCYQGPCVGCPAERIERSKCIN